MHSEISLADPPSPGFGEAGAAASTTVVACVSRAKNAAMCSSQPNHFTFTMPGGFQVPSPGGRIEGASVFGQ